MCIRDRFQHGDDALAVAWVTIEPGMPRLHASHSYFIQLVAARFGITVEENWWREYSTKWWEVYYPSTTFH